MENFKHLPEPPRIRVIESIRHTTHVHREEATTKSGMSPPLLDNEGVPIGLLTGNGTGVVTQGIQAAMVHGDEAYSGSCNYYALAESVKNIPGYQYTIPAHQDCGAEQIYILVLIKKREQEKDLDRSKMTTFSNYFSDTTQGHSQINGCTVRNVYIKEAFNTGVRYGFKSNLDLEGLERGIGGVGPNSVPYIVAAITSDSAGNQPVSLANLKVMYSIAKKYDTPVIMDSARFAEDAYFIRQHEAEYKGWAIEQITRETYKCAGILVMSVRKDTMVLMDGLLCMGDDSFFDVYTGCRTLRVVQEGFSTYDSLEGGVMEHLAVGLYNGVDLDWLVYRITQVQYLADGLEETGVVCQQTGGHAALVDADKLLPHIPAGQFSVQALVCEPYEATGIRTVEIDSFLLGRGSRVGKQLPCPAEPLRLTTPYATYTQIHMDSIIEAFKHVKENAANIRGLTSIYEPKILRHSTTKLKEV